MFTVSVLVAARNEVNNLTSCLSSLAEQDYPLDKYEIIVINDHSTDATAEIAKSFCDNNRNFRLINLDSVISGLKGKMNALTQAIDSSKAELILITDADCRVPPQWITESVKYFTSETGMIGGMVHLSSERSDFWHKLVDLDLMYLLGVAAASAGIGKPATVLGNNFGFRHSAYNQVGGFRKLGYSITEDMLLMNAIDQKTDWKIRYPLVLQTAINSNPPENFTDFVKQRKRWMIGGRKSRPFAYFLMFTAFLTRLIAFFGLAWHGFSFSSLLAVLIVLACDFSVAARLAFRFSKKYLLNYFLFFEIFYLFYSVILAITFFMGNTIEWKGRKL